MIRRVRQTREPVSIAGNTGPGSKAGSVQVSLVTGREVITLAALALTTDSQQGFDLDSGRIELRVYNEGPGVAYAGGRDVSTANGRPIQVGQGWLETSAPDAEWHFVSASTSTLRREVIK